MTNENVKHAINGHNIEQMIYDHVAKKFGTQEACNPSWNIGDLAMTIVNNLHDPDWKGQCKVVYDDEDDEEE